MGEKTPPIDARRRIRCMKRQFGVSAPPATGRNFVHLHMILSQAKSVYVAEDIAEWWADTAGVGLGRNVAAKEAPLPRPTRSWT